MVLRKQILRLFKLNNEVYQSYNSGLSAYPALAVNFQQAALIVAKSAVAKVDNQCHLFKYLSLPWIPQAQSTSFTCECYSPWSEESSLEYYDPTLNMFLRKDQFPWKYFTKRFPDFRTESEEDKEISEYIQMLTLIQKFISEPVTIEIQEIKSHHHNKKV